VPTTESHRSRSPVIADEYNVQRDLRRVWDWFQDEIFQRTPSWIIQMNYRMGLKSRLFNVTRNDIGRGNINIATAREMYVKNKNAFGLNLDDWMWLVNYILSDPGTVLVATLVIKQGQQDLARWLKGRPVEIQEALLVTYYKQGPSYIDRYKARLARNPTAELVPGEGCRVFNQRSAFLDALRLR
jgi:hypothetical protein